MEGRRKDHCLDDDESLNPPLLSLSLSLIYDP
jgi:hypothetical protein